MPTISGAITSLTLDIACKTPFPRYRPDSPSLISRASCFPVDAPEGTELTPFIWEDKEIQVLNVGLPRESRISLALISVMMVFDIF